MKRDTRTDAVIIDRNLCVGCKNCISACPFGAVRIDPINGEVVKCDLCDGQPSCASMCKQGAILYVEKVVAPKIFAHNAATKPMEKLAKEAKHPKSS
jgi:anaerobic carbon-monoxide dehydrogenase iron sulfur subunit